MKENAISTLSEYLHIIEVLHNHYPSGLSGNPVSGHFLYRGLSDEKYQLLPGIYRKQTDFEESLRIENSKYCAWTDEMGLLNGFIHEASSLLPIPPDNRLRWAEYAQHYGVPTRFLDLTSNPLVALYFCCRDQKDRNGTVWLLHAINYKRFFSESITIEKHKKVKEIITELLEGKSEVEYPVLYTPYYVDTRMSSQSSYFLVWGNRKDSLEDMLSDKRYQIKKPDENQSVITYGDDQVNGIIFRFFVYADRKQSLLRELDAVGINEKTLFPGLDGIGRYIERKYRFDYNEAKEVL